MPNKHNEDRRHHIANKSMKVTNWAEYNDGLRRRGSLTLWITEEAIATWQAPALLTRGGQSHYSDTAIETNVLIRAAFRMPLRQAQGLMMSVFELLEVGLAVPNFSTVSRRSAKLPSISVGRLPTGPLHVVIDSTGLKVFGASQWMAEKHGHRSRRCWRKLHLALDANTNQIVACVLASQDVDDPSQVGPLLDQISADIEIDQVTADGAYNGEPTCKTILDRQCDIAVVIPPRAGALPSQADGRSVQTALDVALTTGATGFAGGFSGLATAYTSLVYQTMADAVSEGVATMQTAGFNPDVVAISPADWLAIVVKKGTANDHYLSGSYLGTMPMEMRGLRVVPSPTVAAGKALLMDSSHSELLAVEGFSVEVAYSGDDFTKNLITVLGEMRVIPVFRTAGSMRLVTPKA